MPISRTSLTQKLPRSNTFYWRSGLAARGSIERGIVVYDTDGRRLARLHERLTQILNDGYFVTKGGRGLKIQVVRATMKDSVEGERFYSSNHYLCFTPV